MTRSLVASRFTGLARSATVAQHDLVQSMRAAGAQVLDLGTGEPDFPTPAHISAAATAALRDGHTHYTASRGLPRLRKAIARKLAEDNRITVDPDADVVVTPSGKHALFVALATVLDPGDDLLVPTPSWVSYQSMAHLLGARAVSVPLADDGFRLSRRLLEEHWTPRTKAILVNTPNNPTGRALDAAEAGAIADFACDHDLVVIADEIYEKILYDGRAHFSIGALPGCAERTLTINGFSKGYAMTGWRLGYLAGPTALMAQALKVHEHTVSCAASFSQHGGIAALEGPQQQVHAMADEYAARRDLLVDGLNALPGITCARPDGAFYAFPDITGTGFADSAEFAAWLLRTSAVSVTPGSAFGEGGEGHLRFSFATSRDTIAEALDRTAAAMAAG